MSRGLSRIITDDEADLELLGLASNLRKFGIPMDVAMPEPLVRAFERGIDRQWFTLVDITFRSEALPGRPLKVFRLTDAGMLRLAELGKDLSQ